MNKSIIVVVLLFLFGGGLYLASQVQNTPSANQTANQQRQESSVTALDTRFTGNKLAGTTTPYFEFTQSDYDKAKKRGMIIVLNFYANWCPICRAELPEVKAAFDMLSLQNVVGFQVNFKDDQTDTDEAALAKEFNVPYQHTKIILKNNQRILKETVQWNKQEFIDAVNEAALD